jgi:hypothetical protein
MACWQLLAQRTFQLEFVKICASLRRSSSSESINNMVTAVSGWVTVSVKCHLPAREV